MGNTDITVVESFDVNVEQDDYNLEELQYQLIKKIERLYPNATTNFKAKELGVTEEVYLGLYYCACPSLEFNIAMEEKRLIKKAFAIYSDKSVIFIAKKLGISNRNIYRKLKEHDLWYLILQRKQKEDSSIEFEEIKPDADLDKNYHWETEEKRILSKAMRQNYDKTNRQIAEILGISERTLFNKLKDYNLEHLKRSIDQINVSKSKYGI